MRSGALSSTAHCLSALDYESPMMYRTYFHANQSQIFCKDNRARRRAFSVWYNLVFHAYFMYPKFICSGEICRTAVRFLKNIYSGSYRVNSMTIKHVHNLFKFVCIGHLYCNTDHRKYHEFPLESLNFQSSSSKVSENIILMWDKQ